MNESGLANKDHLNPVFQDSYAANVSASVPASCGELMQGIIGQVDFLVNAPIDMFAEVLVYSKSSSDDHEVRMINFDKVRVAVRNTLKSVGVTDPEIKFFVSSAIPRGKGMASSTAEISSAIQAAASYIGAEVNEVDMTSIILDIDRSTDYLYGPGITMVNHLTGRVLGRFSAPPKLKVIVVDSGGNVETSEFDRGKARAVCQKFQDALRYGLKQLVYGLAVGDTVAIGEAATISAQINQEILYKSEFDVLNQGTKEFGSVGVNCAHTGTVLGVLYDPTKVSNEAMYERVISLVGRKKVLGVWNLIGGGLRVCNNIKNDVCFSVK